MSWLPCSCVLPTMFTPRMLMTHLCMNQNTFHLSLFCAWEKIHKENSFFVQINRQWSRYNHFLSWLKEKHNLYKAISSVGSRKSTYYQVVAAERDFNIYIVTASNGSRFWLYIREIISYSQEVVTPMFISLDLEYIWSNEVYVHEVYDHTRLSMVVCMSSMQVYVEYMVILILYTTIMTF
jgi:hypothetical protein